MKRQLRDYNLDSWRGLALLLMVSDHIILTLAPADYHLLRMWTLPAFPLFMLIAGHLSLSGGRSERFFQIVFVSLAVIPLRLALGLPPLDILHSIAAALLILRFRPGGLPLPLLAVLASYQAIFLPILNFWPGACLVFMVLGSYLQNFYKLPENKILPFVGSYPLTIYFCHWLFIAIFSLTAYPRI